MAARRASPNLQPRAVPEECAKTTESEFQSSPAFAEVPLCHEHERRLATQARQHLVIAVPAQVGGFGHAQETRRSPGPRCDLLRRRTARLGSPASHQGVETIERASNSLHAVSAKWTLRSYRNGTLNLDW